MLFCLQVLWNAQKCHFGHKNHFGKEVFSCVCSQLSIYFGGEISGEEMLESVFRWALRFEKLVEYSFLIFSRTVFPAKFTKSNQETANISPAIIHQRYQDSFIDSSGSISNSSLLFFFFRRSRTTLGVRDERFGGLVIRVTRQQPFFIQRREQTSVRTDTRTRWGERKKK